MATMSPAPEVFQIIEIMLTKLSYISSVQEKLRNVSTSFQILLRFQTASSSKAPPVQMFTLFLTLSHLVFGNHNEAFSVWQ